MTDIYFGDFRLIVLNHIRDIDATNPESHSIEWFLLKYLKRIAKYSETADHPGRVDGSVRSLVRFYVDNIDEKSDLGHRCTHIYEAYRKVLREHQQQDY